MDEAIKIEVDEGDIVENEDGDIEPTDQIETAAVAVEQMKVDSALASNSNGDTAQVIVTSDIKHESAVEVGTNEPQKSVETLNPNPPTTETPLTENKEPQAGESTPNPPPGVELMGDGVGEGVASGESVLPGQITAIIESTAPVPVPEPVPVPVPVPVVEEVKRDPNLIHLILRPVDQDWIMGADVEADFHNLCTLIDVKAYVQEHRGINKFRIQLRMKGRIFTPAKELWTLRRIGLYDNYVIQIEPTLSGSWLWNPREYYANKLLDEVCEIVENTVTPTGSGRINLKVLVQKVKPPPCIKTSLRVFLRQYPERIYIHTDTTDGDLWVHISKRPFQLPTFGNFSVEIGTFPHFQPKPYNWAANKDIDDMYKLELLPEEEEELGAPAGGGTAAAPAVVAGTEGEVVITDDAAAAAAVAAQTAKELALAEATERHAALGNSEDEDSSNNNGNKLAEESILTSNE